MPYDDQSSKLAPLEVFNSDTFIGNNKVPQNICNFILALPLAYNDLRDVTFARILLDEIEIKDEVTPTPQLGLRNGMRVLRERIQSGFIHELLNLISTNREVVDEPLFKELIRKLSKVGKKAWTALYEVAIEKPTNNPLSKAIVQIRNKVAFHYDTQQISKGYEDAFLIQSKYRQPMISRGSRMSETRFYFAMHLLNHT
jgi:hypothetical protein